MPLLKRFRLFQARLAIPCLLFCLGITSISCKSDSDSEPVPSPVLFEISSLNPSSDSTDVAINISPKVAFSKEIDTSSVDASTFRLLETQSGGNTTDVAGEFKFDVATNSVSFDPSNDLKYGTVYQVILADGSQGIRSQEGDILQILPEWIFKTRTLDSDNDGLSDFDEINLYLTDPDKSDTDGDGLNDCAELLAEFDPTDDTDAGSVNDYLNDPIFFFQWHLYNEGQRAGASSRGLSDEDINAVPTWANYAGSPEIVVAVVDSGIEAEHPDLKDNLNLGLSYQYRDGINDPSPTGSEYDPTHGTACAGLIAARGWNGVGLRGVAPFTQLAGLNVFSSGTDADFQDAMARTNVDISSNSWGFDGGDLADYPEDFDSVEQGITLGRGGKGVVYIFAAGNEDFNANASYNVLNSRYVIAVSAVNADGYRSSYSNFGSNVLVAAPGGEYGYSDPAIVTTDLTSLSSGYDTNSEHFSVVGNGTGDYTNLMNGTSSATPIVAGVVALILQSNPDLTYRDVKYILATTARKADPTNIKWADNGAVPPHPFNPFFGFGVVDAKAAADLAKDFIGLPAEKMSTKYEKTENRRIPDNDTIGIETPVEVTESMTIEHVAVWVTITNHNRIGDLEIVLESPTGTQSKLSYLNSIMEGTIIDYNNWQFGTVRHLDEDSNGTWTLRIKDLKSLNSGSLTSWAIQIYGH